MKRSSSLARMPMREFEAMMVRRTQRMAEMINNPLPWIDSTTVYRFYKQHQHLLCIITLENHDVLDVFDETNATVGEAWLWDGKTFYFAREPDALWFSLRWC